MVRNVRMIILGAILFLNGATVSGQTILYVDASATGPGHDGSSWCTAFTELHEALAVATAGSVVRVADGVYRADPTGLADPREATFALSTGVTIEGGYAGCGAPDPDQRDIEQNETILSGDLLANDPDIDAFRGCCNSTFELGCPDADCAAAVCAEQSLCCNIQWQTSCAELAADLCSTLCDSKDDNAYSVVTASGTDATAVLDGLTVTAGFANDPAIELTNRTMGAGMYASGGSPTLNDCTFRHNDANLKGGGMYVENGSPTLSRCTLRDNRATFYNPDGGSEGGAIYLDTGDPVVTDCTFLNNLSDVGGAGVHLRNSNGTIQSCTFRDNFPGTAIFMSFSTPTIEGCSIIANGAGIGCDGSNPTITNCTILGNFSGAIACQGSSPEITNCIIAGNFSGGSGGGIWCIVSSNPTVRNCTIAGNRAFSFGGGIYVSAGSKPSIANCVVWGNTAQLVGAQIYIGDVGAFPAELMVTHSDVQGGPDGVAGDGTLIWGDGNIDADPRFIDGDGADDTFGTEDDNLRLSFGSPCIDAGDNDGVAEGVTTDLDGNARVIDGDADGTATVDMGAYEAGEPIPTLSNWTLGLLGLLLITAGAVVIGRNKRQANTSQTEV